MRFNLPSPEVRRFSSPSAPARRGFTLLEVLVAIVVLSFGVLGVVGLQAAALRANKDARYQSTAVAMGRELADLMRGTKDVAISATPGTNPYLGDFPVGSVVTSTENCFTAACTTPRAVASFNMSGWLARVQAALPGVRIRVCFDATPYAAGLPQWGCTNSGGLAVVKMGWSRQSYDRSAQTMLQAVDATPPVVILPLIAGSVE